MPSATADARVPCSNVAPWAFSSTSDVGCNETVTPEGSLLLTLPPTFVSDVGPAAPLAPPPTPDPLALPPPPDPLAPPLLSPFCPPLLPPLLPPLAAPLLSDSRLLAAAASAFLAALPS